MSDKKPKTFKDVVAAAKTFLKQREKEFKTYKTLAHWEKKEEETTLDEKLARLCYHRLRDHINDLKKLLGSLSGVLQLQEQLQKLREAVLSFNEWIIEIDGRGISSEVHEEFNDRFKRLFDEQKGSVEEKQE